MVTLIDLGSTGSSGFALVHVDVVDAAGGVFASKNVNSIFALEREMRHLRVAAASLVDKFDIHPDVGRVSKKQE